jgi:hypothetical protein
MKLFFDVICKPKTKVHFTMNHDNDLFFKIYMNRMSKYNKHITIKFNSNIQLSKKKHI